MTVNSLNDYSTTPASNADIAGTSIAVGCAPADVGIFMRTVMAQIAYAVQGSGGTVPLTWNVGSLTTTTTGGGTGNGHIVGNLQVDGNLIVSGTSPGWVVVSNVTLAAVSSQTVLLSGSYRRFRLTVQNCSVSTAAANLQLQFSSNGGLSFFNSNYVFVTLNADTVGAIVTASSTTAGAIPLSAQLTAGGTALADLTYEISPGSASARATVKGSTFCVSSASQFTEQFITGNYSGGVALMNGISFSVTSGTMSGTLILEGLS